MVSSFAASFLGCLLLTVAGSTGGLPGRPDPADLPAALAAEDGQCESRPRGRRGSRAQGLADSFSTVLLQHLVTWRDHQETKVLFPKPGHVQESVRGKAGEQGARAALLATHSAVHSEGFPLATASAQGATPVGSLSLSASKTARSASQTTSSTSTGSARSALSVAIFFIVMCCLSLVSVLVYLRSLMAAEDSKEAASASSTPTGATGAGKLAHAQTDDALNMSTPTGRARPRLLRRNTVTVSELKQKYWTIDDSNESMSAPVFVVNMFVDLCPPGLLPLAFGMKDTGYIPGFIMLAALYCFCVYTMFAISKSMQITNGKDFASQWSAAIGGGSSWLPVLVVCIVCLGCNLTYSCFFADLFTGVMPALGLRMNRSMALLAFTVFPTLPLCLLKNLSALSYSSSFAFCAVIYSVIVMVVRCLDGTYVQGGKYYGDLPQALIPNVPASHLYGFGLPSLVLVNILATCFLSHYNGCKYYRELQNNTPTKLFKCTATAMGICVLIFAIVIVSTFQTFGLNADGVILKNYSEKDWYINVARLVMGLSIIASFPLMFSGLREATITLLKLANPAGASEWDLVWKQDVLSMVLLAVVTGIAIVVTDAGLVVGIVGSICGSVIIYIVPCTLYAGAIKGFLVHHNALELAWLRCLTALGAFLAIAGTYSSIMF